MAVPELCLVTNIDIVSYEHCSRAGGWFDELKITLFCDTFDFKYKYCLFFPLRHTVFLSTSPLRLFSSTLFSSVYFKRAHFFLGRESSVAHVCIVFRARRERAGAR